MYVLLFKSLPVGNHLYDWTIDGSFFASFEMSEINNASINVGLTLVKHTRFLELNFVFNGWAEVNCDRCLDPVKIDIASDTRMFVSFGEDAGHSGSDEHDVIVLPYDEDRLDVAQYLYEYAHLSLPLRRVHPDDDHGQSGCNAEMISKLEQYLVNH